MGHFRWLTAGESHGPKLVSMIDGVPAGLPLLAEQIDEHLARRQRGYGRGGRMKIETDRVELASGVRGGETLGSPIAMIVQNRDYASWQGRMGPEPFSETPEALTRPRPGHADLAGGLKYDRHDLRDILERASARETASRVAVGAVARTLLATVGIDIFGHVRSIGDVQCAPLGEDGAPIDYARIKELSRASDLACADADAEQRMRDAIKTAAHAGDTLGGVFEVVALGVPVGLGSHTQWDRKLDGRLAQALVSIHAVKGAEVGDGWLAATLPGSRVHDPIGYDATAKHFTRETNHAGGLEGGITNGEPLICRAAMKPISTLKKALRSVDIRDKQPFDAAHERSDICAVAAASIVGEAMVAIVLADALLEKFGGDSVRELVRNVTTYREQMRDW